MPESVIMKLELSGMTRFSRAGANCGSIDKQSSLAPLAKIQLRVPA